MIKHTKPCPGSCKGNEGQGRQRALLPSEAAEINGLAHGEINKNPHSAMRCSYCAAVYINGSPKLLLGYLDCAILGQGWHPVGRFK